MACRNEQILRAGARIDRLGLDRHIVEFQRPTDRGEARCEYRLRLECDHPAVANPARQPVDETALVGADVAGDIARPEVAPDHVELGPLIAKQSLQRPGPKPDTLNRKPGLENGHRSTISIDAFVAPGLTCQRVRFAS